jgi:hypothetical protein
MAVDLSPDALARARSFVGESARPLERARAAFLFDGAPRSDVLAELAAFRNSDGGFGHALGPDLRMPGSSVIATTHGLQTLREVNADAGEPLARGAVAWLLASYDPDARTWPLIPPEANHHPRAPWWTYADEGQAEAWGHYLANPRAEIVGYLYDYAPLVRDDLRDTLTADVVRHAEEHADALAMFDLLCYKRLLETPDLPDGIAERLVRALLPAVRAHVQTEPGAWADYGLRPLDMAPAPDTAFAGELSGAVDANLDYLIRTQQADGSWAPTWSWDDDYPDVWAQAEVEWRGRLVVDNLCRLAAWGRLPAA